MPWAAPDRAAAAAGELLRLLSEYRIRGLEATFGGLGMSQSVASIALPRVATPPLKWAGGKRQLLPEIRKHVPELFGRYFEPFVGGGAVFFDLYAAGRISRKAWLGDANMELMLTYSTIVDNVVDLIESLRVHAAQHSEKHFYEVRALRGLPPLANAARMIYLNKTCFNGLYRVNRNGGFNVPFGRYKNPNICDVENLHACSAALKGVQLNCVNFTSIASVVCSGDFVYYDPPYWPVSETSDFTSYTPGGFTKTDQERLAEHARQMRSIGVHVLLSNADLPQVRELYNGFEMRTVQAKRNVNSKGDKRGSVGELLIW
jgi:DNA adenine methylase